VVKLKTLEIMRPSRLPFLPGRDLPLRWLVTGASGLLGHDLVRRLLDAGFEVVAVRNEHPIGLSGAHEIAADLERDGSLAELVERFRPGVAVHAAGLTNVDACEKEEKKAFRLHALAAGELARSTRKVGGVPVLISTDHLWAGTDSLVDETMPVDPVNAYARTKAAGEDLFLDAAPGGLIVRTNFFGIGRPWRRSFSDWIEDCLRQGNKVHAFRDVFFTPIALDLLTASLCELVAVNARGVLHVAGGERISKFEFARRLAIARALQVEHVLPGSIEDASLTAPRPRDMSLSTKKVAALLGRAMPDLDASLGTLELAQTNG
jgi:dTDP-4-dehydrorhamnose reductase